MKRAAFIFLAPEADPEVNRETVHTPTMNLDAVAVPNYAAAAETAKKLAEEGIPVIELCGGFGIEGMALVKKAVEGKARIGAVRFDGHPGLDNQSGDDIFG